MAICDERRGLHGLPAMGAAAARTALAGLPQGAPASLQTAAQAHGRPRARGFRRLSGAAQPYQTIIDVKKEQGCDLIVMASHGRRGVAAIVLGSEVVKVLTHSTIPVLVVRPKIDPLAFLKGS
jgi:nucleotide-binding universal stress UspA family protein